MAETMAEAKHESRLSRLRFEVQITEILWKHDPMGLTRLGCPTDEYSPEAETITALLLRCDSRGGVQEMIHAEFTAWFCEDVVRPLETFESVAEEIWQEWIERGKC
jgi:hypothetical protein